MATFNEAKPSVGSGTMPPTLPTIGGSTWGIDNTLSSCIIQSEQISEEDIVDQTQDQKGAVVNCLTYDRHKTLNLVLLTDKVDLSSIVQSGQTDFSYGGSNWFVNSITYNGSYNAKKQWTIQAERWYNYP